MRRAELKARCDPLCTSSARARAHTSRYLSTIAPLAQNTQMKRAIGGAMSACQVHDTKHLYRRRRRRDVRKVRLPPPTPPARRLCNWCTSFDNMPPPPARTFFLHRTTVRCTMPMLSTYKQAHNCCNKFAQTQSRALLIQTQHASCRMPP